MKSARRSRRSGLRPRLLLSLIALLLVLLASPGAALAHPADVYLQATYITVAPTQVGVELDLSPGVLVAPQVLPLLDSDGDEQISDAESQAYVNSVLSQLELQVDGAPLALAVTKIDITQYLNFQAGYGTIRVFTTATLPENTSGTHVIDFRNNFAPAGSAYQVNTFVEKGAAITLGTQNRDDIQQSISVDYTIGAATAPARASASTAAATETWASSTQSQQLLAFLQAPALSPWVLALALALAVLLGGLHALTPGHGKTLVAAYLVGSRGTVRHAITLGAIVTFTHTASVIAIGLLALFASQFVVPGVLVPVLEVFSGLLVVLLGGRLIAQRWLAFRKGKNAAHSHDNDHSHDHDHAHSHDYDHSHDHTLAHDHGDGHVHTHLPPAEGVSFRSLLAMGVSGGLVPCPEALGIMVIAIGLNRIALGLGLIVSFSAGLAAVLIAIGVLLVRSRALLDRFGGAGSGWGRALPLASALIVTVLGLGITLGGLSAYLG